MTKTEEASKEAAVTVASTAPDGAKLFTACAGCHGTKAEKKALGKSQIIAGWNATKTENALKGYQDGTYGGAMKAVMQGQASKLSDADIKALAEYISKL
nr:c-type cytochrome [Sulfurimonas paralvinellae]